MRQANIYITATIYIIATLPKQSPCMCKVVFWVKPIVLQTKKRLLNTNLDKKLVLCWHHHGKFLVKQYLMIFINFF